MFFDVLGNLFDPVNLLIGFCGSLFGIFCGAVPGLTATSGIALMLPLSFKMNPITAIIFLGSIYVGGISGGLVASILIGIPGSPSSVATVFDGYPMAQSGKAGKALGIGILSSFLGTIASVSVAVVFCPVIARFAVKLGPWEIFSLCFCAIVLVVTMSKGNMYNGLMAGFLGMFLSTIGIAPIDGAKRFTMGIPNLLGGINQVGFLLGVFAIAILISNFAKGEMKSPDVDTKGLSGFGISLKEYFSHKVVIIQSFLIGIWIGFLPGMGPGLSNVVAYAQAKSSSKNPEKFGTGCVEGIIAPELSSNASIGGAIIPMISLGIPGDMPTAMLIGGLMIQGIEVGPLFMTNNPGLVYTFFGILLFSACLTVTVQFFSMRAFPHILRIPINYLYTIIFIICFIGAYSDSRTMFNCWLILFLGAIGVLLQLGGLPMSPLVLGFILGPMLEQNLRMGLTYTKDGFLPFITRPISGITLFVAVASTLWPYIREKLEKKKQQSGRNSIADEVFKRGESFNVKED